MGYVGTAGVPSTVAELPAGSPWTFDFFAVPPMVGTEHEFVQDSGWSFAVPNTSRNPAVAWDIARSLALSAEDMRRWSSVTGALPALKENATPETAAEHPYASKVLHLLPRGRWFGFVPLEAYRGIQRGHRDELLCGRLGREDHRPGPPRHADHGQQRHRGGGQVTAASLAGGSCFWQRLWVPPARKKGRTQRVTSSSACSCRSQGPSRPTAPTRSAPF